MCIPNNYIIFTQLFFNSLFSLFSLSLAPNRGFQAGRGGAIAASGFLQVTNSSFFNCSATSSDPDNCDGDCLGLGGAIQGGSSTHMSISDSRFELCKARWNDTTLCGGGGILSENKTLLFLHNNTFKNIIGGDVVTSETTNC